MEIKCKVQKAPELFENFIRRKFDNNMCMY